MDNSKYLTVNELAEILGGSLVRFGLDDIYCWFDEQQFKESETLKLERLGNLKGGR